MSTSSVSKSKSPTGQLKDDIKDVDDKNNTIDSKKANFQPEENLFPCDKSNCIPAIQLKCSSEIPSDHHRLQYAYTFWFSRKADDSYSYLDKKNAVTRDVFEQMLKPIGTIMTVEDFWSFYCHMTLAHDLKDNSDYALFKHGIRPMWEDEKNQFGGKLTLTSSSVKKDIYNYNLWPRSSEQSSGVYEIVLLLMIGEQFTGMGEHINGVVFNKRRSHDRISIWLNTTNIEVVHKIKNTFYAKVKESVLKQGFPIEYIKWEVHENLLQKYSEDKFSGDKYSRSVGNDRGYGKTPGYNNHVNNYNNHYNHGPFRGGGMKNNGQYNGYYRAYGNRPSVRPVPPTRDPTTFRNDYSRPPSQQVPRL